jgi:hypothetical protein
MSKALCIAHLYLASFDGLSAALRSEANNGGSASEIKGFVDWLSNPSLMLK